MPAPTNTLYALTLFLSLAALKLWSERRHRVLYIFRAGVARTLCGDR